MHTMPSDVIAEQIRKHRKRLGLTRENLAEECAKLGAPQLTFAALTNIETGRRDRATGRRRREVTVDELEVIAHALAVPMLLLVFPVGDLDRVPTISSGQEIHPRLAWKCAIGAEPPVRLASDGRAYADRSTIGEGGPTRLEAWRSVVRPIELYQELMNETDALHKAERRLAYFERVGHSDSDEAQHLLEVRQHHLIRMATVLEEMMNSGIRVPAYEVETARDLIATDVITRPEALPLLPVTAEASAETDDDQP
ncbi:hypothetical protein GCM10014719_65490 [Planomonospora parontospora subsp. antibiotica]|nr:hypothetical protein GCM10014719_65490 [Planomonospora parontospora subsp. antibiotica]GII19775.1 hypothetical protein Ppa05_65010 [Planomonospora parontospora subsp. antibiotica]